MGCATSAKPSRQSPPQNDNNLGTTGAIQVKDDSNNSTHNTPSDSTANTEHTPPGETANSQQSASPSEDNQFIKQDFSQELLKQILKVDRGCFDMNVVCSYRKFTFRDVVLITESSDYGEVSNVSLIPNQSISQEQALSFSRILDDSGEIDFEKSKQLDPDTVSYLGCLGDDDITSARVENFLGCYVRLHLTPDGNVSKIELIHSSD